jgi:hypothetical protein
VVQIFGAGQQLWRGILALMILIWGMSVKYKKVLIAKEKVG